MDDKTTPKDWMAERAARIQARAFEHRYSEKTHLIHGRFQSTAWDYKHHVVPPQSSSVTYRLDTSKRGAQGFLDFGHHDDGQTPIYIYDRLDEPTRSMLEQNLAYAEEGERAICFASGMAAIAAALCANLRSGEHVVAHKVLYGCTFSFVQNWLPRFGIANTTCDFNDLAALQAAIRPETRALYFETPVNPDLVLIDIEAVVKLVRQINEKRPEGQRILTIVDNTFSTPYGQRPLNWGVDIVVSSLTKGIGGFGTDLGGVVVCPTAMEPSLLSFRKDFGGVLSPKAAWPILVYGLPTLAVRIRQQQQTAEKVARFLEGQPAVSSVRYPGLPSFPQRALAERQMRDYEGTFAPGTLIYFTIGDGPGEPAGYRAARFNDHVAENSYSITMAVSLGQVKTLIEHPYSMTHSALTCSEKSCHLVDPGGLRISIGLEKGEDIIFDLQEALDAVCPLESTGRLDLQHH